MYSALVSYAMADTEFLDFPHLATVPLSYYYFQQ